MIPANTPVILKGNEGTYYFNTTTAAAFNEANSLDGTIAAETYPSGAFTLQMNNGVVGFYDKAPTNNVIPGFKAYLPANEVPANVKGLTFIFDTPTGIVSTQKNDGEATIYNLAGQRVEKAQKGIYIVNGKKVLVK